MPNPANADKPSPVSDAQTNPADSKANLLPDLSDGAWKHAGRPLTTLSTADGDKLSFSYDQNGKLFSIVHDNGTTFTKANDGNWFQTKPGMPAVYQPCKVLEPSPGKIILRYPDQVITYTHDGVEVKDRRQPETKEAQSLTRARNLLARSIERHCDQPADLRLAMAQFELRCEEQRVPKTEIEKTYSNVRKLLDWTGTGPTSQEQRVKLAEQILQQAAQPELISQGNHNTCNVTTVESFVYTKYPSAAAKLITDLATHGNFVYRGQSAERSVHVLRQTDLAEKTEAKSAEIMDGRRSYASQVFQVAAVNIHWTMEPGLDGKPGSTRYEQLDINTNEDTGERLWDTSQTPPVERRRSPFLDASEIARICNCITNEQDCIVLTHESSFDQRKRTFEFTSETELRDALKLIKSADRFPVILLINSNQHVLWNDQGGQITENIPWHVVTIRDFDANGNRVAIANQWGSAYNHLGQKAVSLRDLYLSSSDYAQTGEDNTSIPELERQVEHLKKTNRRDIQVELELVRLKHLNEDIEDQQYRDQILQLAKDSKSVWTGTMGTLEVARKNRALRQLELMIKDEEFDFKVAVRKALR